MSNGSEAVIAAAAIANAIKASGAIVRVEPIDFQTILSKVNEPLVVQTYGGIFSKSYKYLTAYKGLVFFTKSSNPLELPHRTELILAKRIWIPDTA